MTEVVKLLKLASGEEMVCRVDSEKFDDPAVEKINFRDGRTVGMNQQTGGFGLMNFAVLAGELQKGSINKSAVIADMEMSSEFEKKYLGEVSGGIVVPTA